MKNKIAYTIVRVLLGIAFLVFGANKIFPFMPVGELPQPAMDFLVAMMGTGYFMPFLGLVEILVGILLLANFWVPLAMIILSPIMLNIVLFTVFLAPGAFGMGLTALFVILQVYVMYCTWGAYKSLFMTKTVLM